MPQHSIILFDGICNLCNGAVQFIIRRDKKDYFRFTSLQSPEGQKLSEQYKFPLNNFESFILISGGKAYSKSTAVLKVAGKLHGLWPLMYGFMIIPEFLRDVIYNWVAKNRYKWFGKKDECMLPTPQSEARFLN